MPVIQTSLKRDLNPLDHFMLGEALSPLREQGMFIIGSGNSYHNVGNMFNPTTKAIKDSERFDSWLKQILPLEADRRKAELMQ